MLSWRLSKTQQEQPEAEAGERQGDHDGSKAPRQAHHGHPTERRLATETALSEFMQAPIQRYGHLALLERIWRLAANLTAYDASYIALAELLGADLLIVDKRLATAPGIRCRVEVL